MKKRPNTEFSPLPEAPPSELMQLDQADWQQVKESDRVRGGRAGERGVNTRHEEEAIVRESLVEEDTLEAQRERELIPHDEAILRLQAETGAAQERQETLEKSKDGTNADLEDHRQQHGPQGPPRPRIQRPALWVARLLVLTFDMAVGKAAWELLDLPEWAAWLAATGTSALFYYLGSFLGRALKQRQLEGTGRYPEFGLMIAAGISIVGSAVSMSYLRWYDVAHANDTTTPGGAVLFMAFAVIPISMSLVAALTEFEGHSPEWDVRRELETADRKTGRLIDLNRELLAALEGRLAGLRSGKDRVEAGYGYLIKRQRDAACTRVALVRAGWLLETGDQEELERLVLPDIEPPSVNGHGALVDRAVPTFTLMDVTAVENNGKGGS